MSNYSISGKAYENESVDFNSSFKKIRMKYARHVTHREENGTHNGGFVEKPTRKSYMEDISIDGRVTCES